MGTDLAKLPPAWRRSRGPRPAQLQGVESPATVLLHPAVLGSGNGHPEVVWWSHEKSPVLVGGLEVRHVARLSPEAMKGFYDKGKHETGIGYLPTPIPRSWTKREFRVVVELESEHKDSNFQIRLYYGCGDPSDIRLGESEWITGKSYGRERIPFPLKAKYLDTNELFRATIVIHRKTTWPVLVYGAWLEIGVED